MILSTTGRGETLIDNIADVFGSKLCSNLQSFDYKCDDFRFEILLCFDFLF